MRFSCVMFLRGACAHFSDIFVSKDFQEYLIRYRVWKSLSMILIPINELSIELRKFCSEACSASCVFDISSLRRIFSNPRDRSPANSLSKWSSLSLNAFADAEYIVRVPITLSRIISGIAADDWKPCLSASTRHESNRGLWRISLMTLGLPVLMAVLVYFSERRIVPGNSHRGQIVRACSAPYSRQEIRRVRLFKTNPGHLILPTFNEPVACLQ